MRRPFLYVAGCAALALSSIAVRAEPPVGASAEADFAAVGHERRTIYHSPQKPGFTSWVGAWTMPDGNLMVSFTQATGPVAGRPRAPADVQQKLGWPPAGEPGYDMTGLDLRNVHLRSADAGKTWTPVSADRFRSCMNGVTCEAETALPDGTVVRGVWGFYLPYDRDVPPTGYLQRSADGTKTWGKPEVLLDPKRYTAWPRRVRRLRDGRLVVLLGVARVPAGSHTRAEFGRLVEPMLVVSSDRGRTWQGPIPALRADQRGGWTEEFDAAELANGDLLCVYRRAEGARRWQGLLQKSGATWVAQRAGSSILPHSGHPELLATREGPILHLATMGIHWTTDAGQTWHPLHVPRTAYYPHAVQARDGRILVFGHVGGDDAYGKVDQSIVMDSFRLRERVPVMNRRSLAADRVEVERVALGEPDDYKPCIARLPSGELLLTAFHQYQKGNGKVLEQTLLFRSHDGGRTWSKPAKLDLLGREPYLSVLADGTVFITGHLLANDVRNRHGYTHGYLHRSADAGKTWQSIRIESEKVKPNATNHSTRNVLQLHDGTLLLGVDYDGGGGPYLLWRSRDNGRTWDKTGKCQPKDFQSKYGFFGGETWLWQARSGKIWALVRVDSTELPIRGRPIRATNDQADHFILFSSADGGRTFDRIRDIGDYGEMYLSILRLADRRLLLTFTVRDLAPRLGVRAVPGVETEDGFTFDLSSDRVMLDSQTPPGKAQGGGFGPTVQLADGTLVTSYSYRGADDRTHLEVVRWKLPPGPGRHAAVFSGFRAGEERVVAGVKLCWCPPGRFTMGSPPGEPERRPGEDQVEVTLTRGFWTGKYEVTQGQWKRVMGQLPGPVTAELPAGEDYPLGNVNFAEAEAFCARLTELARQSGEMPEDWEFRLPTEAQWEYACRAGTTTATAFGDKHGSKQANVQNKPYNGGEEGPWLGKAAKVGRYPPNTWGIHDMHGNVVEWCRDWYHTRLPGGTDPDLHDAKATAAPNRTRDYSRSRRGSAWTDPAWASRSAFRQRFEPERRYDHIGFRVVAVRPR